MDQFTKAYVDCALWSSTDNEGVPLDNNYSIDDLAPGTLAKMIEDCQMFQALNGYLFDGRVTLAGHDYWLTRNGHGAGFWDGDWLEHGTELTRWCHKDGPYDLYVGDDGLIYGSP